MTAHTLHTHTHTQASVLSAASSFDVSNPERWVEVLTRENDRNGMGGALHSNEDHSLFQTIFSTPYANGTRGARVLCVRMSTHIYSSILTHQHTYSIHTLAQPGADDAGVGPDEGSGPSWGSQRPIGYRYETHSRKRMLRHSNHC
jgi:hypothetical protein